jgi:hypothetical protein
MSLLVGVTQLEFRKQSSDAKAQSVSVFEDDSELQLYFTNVASLMQVDEIGELNSQFG